MLEGPISMMLEVWRDVAGWPNYEVSDFGRVRRKGRKTRPGYRYKGRYITEVEPLILHTVSRDVDLHYKGQGKKHSVAELVLTAFVGPRPADRPIARHLDDDWTNNNLENLAWGTRLDNRLDAVRNGRQSAGSEWARKVSAKLKGKPRPPEVIARIVATRRANGWFSEATRHKMSLSHLGKKPSGEARRNMLRAQQLRRKRQEGDHA